MRLEKLVAAQDRAGRIAAGLTPRVVLGKLATIQMLDVCIPTVEGRELLLIRHTEPSTDVALLLEKLNLTLPPQPPPKIHYGLRSSQICQCCAKSGRA